LFDEVVCFIRKEIGNNRFREFGHLGFSLSWFLLSGSLIGYWLEPVFHSFIVNTIASILYLLKFASATLSK
jgi:hypothetical protein